MTIYVERSLHVDLTEKRAVPGADGGSAACYVLRSVSGTEFKKTSRLKSFTSNGGQVGRVNVWKLHNRLSPPLASLVSREVLLSVKENKCFGTNVLFIVEQQFGCTKNKKERMRHHLLAILKFFQRE